MSLDPISAPYVPPVGTLVDDPLRLRAPHTPLMKRMRQDGAARVLRQLLGRARQEAAVEERVTTPSEPVVESWLTRFERRQEEAA